MLTTHWQWRCSMTPADWAAMSVQVHVACTGLTLRFCFRRKHTWLCETREEEKKSIFDPTLIWTLALSSTRLYSRYTHHVKAEPIRAHAIGLATIVAPTNRICHDRGGQGQGGPAHGTLGRG
jgi:hypothetical protein